VFIACFTSRSGCGHEIQDAQLTQKLIKKFENWNVLKNYNKIILEEQISQ